MVGSFGLVTEKHDSELKQLHASSVDEYGKLVMRNETTRTRRACETVKVTSRQRHPMNKKSMTPRGSRCVDQLSAHPGRSNRSIQFLISVHASAGVLSRRRARPHASGVHG